MKLKIIASAAGMVVLAVAGLAYLVLGVFGIDPGAKLNRMTIEFSNSGGLMETSAVALNGQEIGRVRSLSAVPRGVVAEIEVDSRYRIPVDSTVTVANLSAVGEQYLAFTPMSSEGPYLDDGARISGSQVVEPLTVTRALSALDDFVGQIQPNEIIKFLAGTDKAFDGVGPNIDHLVKAGNLFATTVRQNRDLVQRLLTFAAGASASSGEQSTVAMEAVKTMAGRVLPEVPALIDNLVLLVDGSGAALTPLMPLLDKVWGYLDLLLPDIGAIIDVVKPMYLDQIQAIDVDASKAMDALLDVFPDGRGMRVLVNIPR